MVHVAEWNIWGKFRSGSAGIRVGGVQLDVDLIGVRIDRPGVVGTILVDYSEVQVEGSLGRVEVHRHRGGCVFEVKEGNQIGRPIQRIPPEVIVPDAEERGVEPVVGVLSDVVDGRSVGVRHLGCPAGWGKSFKGVFVELEVRSGSVEGVFIGVHGDLCTGNRREPGEDEENKGGAGRHKASLLLDGWRKRGQRSSHRCCFEEEVVLSKPLGQGRKRHPTRKVPKKTCVNQPPKRQSNHEEKILHECPGARTVPLSMAAWRLALMRVAISLTISSSRRRKWLPARKSAGAMCRTRSVCAQSW